MAHPDIVVEKNLRAYPGVERGSTEWEETYKIRVNVEKSINHFKDSFCVANRKTQNEKTLHADLLLAGIATQKLSFKWLIDFSTFTRILYVSSHSAEPRSTPG